MLGFKDDCERNVNLLGKLRPNGCVNTALGLTTMQGCCTMDESLLPTPEELRQLLRYEPETGHLYWLPRHGKQRDGHFNNVRAGKRAGFPLSNGRLQVSVIGGDEAAAHF